MLYPRVKGFHHGSVEEIHDYNIVIYSQIYGIRFLWTGDMEKQHEAQLLNRYPKLKVDVLKVAHHGSKTSTSDRLLSSIRPQLGLISVGEKNYFGHPHPKVIHRLQEHTSNIFRTDRHGGVTIILTSDNLRLIPTLQPLKE